MTFFSKPKRKNDDAPRFPAWIVVVVAIGLVLVAFLFFRSPTQSVTVQATLPPCRVIDPPILTATALAAQNSPLDPLELTATYIVMGATDQANGLGQPCSTIDLDQMILTVTAQAGAVSTGNLDPMQVTATYLIEQATSQALGTPQGGATTSSTDLDPFLLTATAAVQMSTDMAATSECAKRMGCGG